MFDLIIRNGKLVDPLHSIESIMDIGITDGKVVEISEEIAGACKKVIEAKGKVVVPGIIDMHTHMRTQLGHPHAQRMIALAGVCTTLDMAGPLQNILDSIPGSGAGVNIAILEAARNGFTLTSNRPDAAERNALIDKTLEEGGIGIKLLGGHFPMDLDISELFVEDCAKKNAWIAWHAGNSQNGSNIKGFADAVECSHGRFLHVAHINSYCRGQVKEETQEALEAIEILKSNPNIFSESYLSPLNGTRFNIEENRPVSKVTETCLRKVGCEPSYDGMKRAILLGRAGVLYDDGTIGRLLYGHEGVEYWEKKKTQTTGSFSVNPAVSRFLLAQAKRKDGSFVVDCFSTDGGCYPRNVIVENGLLLIKFGAISLREFAIKSSLNGARALNLPSKGHLGVGADADVTILDIEAEKAFATIVGGNVIMEEGKLCGSGTTIICDERGENYLRKRKIKTIVKGALTKETIQNRFVP